MQYDLSSCVVGVVPYVGPAKPRVVFVSAVPSWDGKPFSVSGQDLLTEYARRAGLHELDFGFASMLDFIPPGRRIESVSLAELRAAEAMLITRLELMPQLTVVVPTDSASLAAVTDKSNIHKWHLSIIPAKRVRGEPKCIPILGPDIIFRTYSEIPFLIFGMGRIKEEINSRVITVEPTIFHINPALSESIEFLQRCLKAEMLSVDIETAKGQITCIGFALSPVEAICIPALPEQYSVSDFHLLWSHIREVLESGSKKIFQNFVYDTTYLSKYGIAVKNVWHDTMHANKFLHPELPMGLDTIARIYTREPYWKDEGKNWSDIGAHDIDEFYRYNCKDTTATFKAALGQRRDMAARGSTDVYERYVAALFGPAAEMSWRGFPIDSARRDSLRKDMDESIEKLNSALGEITAPVMGKAVSSRSPKQVKDYLKKCGMRIPIAKGKETSNVTALLKLQQKYPNQKALALLIELSEKNKSISSYLKPEPYADNRIRYSMRVNATDNNRWSCSKDPWDNGFNAQTMPAWFKKAIQAPPGFVFLEIDLKQADARVVAWDAPEPTLIQFFNSGRDIHRFVASRPELFNKPEAEISKEERQLGKKTGHAANYGMRGQTHSDACLLEMGVVMSPERAQMMLDGYHKTFPGIRMWQMKIQQQLRNTKKLQTPFGRERIFYGKLDDNMYRAAYAYRPPSVVADVIDSLIVHSHLNRDPEKLHHIAQVHDSYIALVHETYLNEAKSMVFAQNEWNPKIALAGGELQIPIEVKVGENLGSMIEVLG